MEKYCIYLVWSREQTGQVDISIHEEKIKKYASIRKTIPAVHMLIVLVKQVWESRLLDYCDEEALDFSLVVRDFHL